MQVAVPILVACVALLGFFLVRAKAGRVDGRAATGDGGTDGVVDDGTWSAVVADESSDNYSCDVSPDSSNGDRCNSDSAGGAAD